MGYGYGGRGERLRGGRGGGGGRGIGRGRMGGFRAGVVGYYICSKCGYRMVHTRGIPCYQQICPRCGSPMMRDMQR